MDASLLLDLAMRWAHILAAIVAVGGTIFIWAILNPALARAGGDAQVLRSAIMRRWRMAVHTCILLLLISGTYNYLAVTRPAHAGQSWYDYTILAKVILAIAVFALAVALTSGQAWSARMRTSAAPWTRALVLLAVLVVLLSGVLKIAPRAQTEEATVKGSLNIGEQGISLEFSGPDTGNR